MILPKRAELLIESELMFWRIPSVKKIAEIGFTLEKAQEIHFFAHKKREDQMRGWGFSESEILESYRVAI